MSEQVDYRQKWADGEIEAGTLLDAIESLQYANIQLAQKFGVAHAAAEALRAENERLTKDCSAEMFLTMTGEVTRLRTELEEARGLLERVHYGLEKGHPLLKVGDEIRAFLTATPAPEVRQAEQRWSSFDEWLTWELDQGDGTMAAASDAETRLACRLWFCLERAPLAEQGELQEAAAPDALRKRFGEIEDEVARGKHNAMSCFTAMRTAALYTPQPGPDVRGLVDSIQAVVNAVIVPVTMTPAKAEYYKAGARHIIAKVNEALAAHRQAQQGDSHDT